MTRPESHHLLVATLILLLPVIQTSAQTWDIVDLGTTKSIYALGAASGWAVGDSGFVARTTDYVTWDTVDVHTTRPLFSVMQLAGNQWWVAGDSGVVRVGSSAGWSPRDIPTNERVNLYSRSSGCSYAAAGAGGLFKTCDFGQNWEQLNYGSSVPLNHGSGFVNTLSWAVGDSGLVLKTVNGGADWVTQPTGTTANLNYLLQAGGSMIAIGDGGTIVRASNTGENWSVVPIAATADLHSVDGSGLNAAWNLAVGDEGTILKTTDGGESWCQITGVTDVDLYAVRMVTNSHYIVAGEGGVMLRTTDGGGECVFVSVEKDLQVQELAVDGPYPQPGSDVVTFDVVAARAERLTARVYDLLGREVQALGGFSRSGAASVRVEIELTGLQAGSYFVRFDDGERRATRSIVVSR